MDIHPASFGALTMTPIPPVLVVDDELGARSALRMIVERDFPVLTAASGEEALEIVRETEVGVVTLDLRMPGLDGLETLERLRALQHEMNVVIVTGVPSLDTAVKGLRLGAFDYLVKPFDSARVADTVRRAHADRMLRSARPRESEFERVTEELVRRTSSLDRVLGSARRADEIDYLQLLAQGARDGAGGKPLHWLDRFSSGVQRMIDDGARRLPDAALEELSEVAALARSLQLRAA